mgnify:CR=1 FL=1
MVWGHTIPLVVWAVVWAMAAVIREAGGLILAEGAGAPNSCHHSENDMDTEGQGRKELQQQGRTCCLRFSAPLHLCVHVVLIAIALEFA